MRLLPYLVFALCLLCACERPSYDTDDLAAAQEAAEQRDWTQVARLLQRYLREENVRKNVGRPGICWSALRNTWGRTLGR